MHWQAAAVSGVADVSISKLLRAAVATVLIAASAAVGAQQARLAPVDEAAADASWANFKTRLLDALAKRDQKALLAMVDSRIRNISGKNGAPEFRRLWQPHSADSALWKELPKLLFLGGAYIKPSKGPAEFCAPYVRYKWPDNAPPDADGAIIAREVLLKTKPSASAPTQRTLSYDLVNVLDWEVADVESSSPQKWVKILADRAIGYVPEEQVRSPLEHRACFVKTGTSWRIVAFEVGE